MKFFNQFHGKITDIHQENRVELANIADLTDVELPIIFRPNKFVLVIIGIFGVFMGLFNVASGVLSVPVFMSRNPDEHWYLIGMAMAVCGIWLCYLGLQKLLILRYQYTLAIYDDKVEFVGNGFNKELDFIGFDRGYLAQRRWHRKSVDIYLYYVSFSDDGTEYRTHEQRIFYATEFDKHQADDWAKIINALIIKYQTTHQIDNIPKVKFITQR